MQKSFIFIAVGLLISTGILFANDRDIVINDFLSDSDTSAWEVSFLTYVLFAVGGLLYDLITVRKYKMMDASISILSFIISYLTLEVVKNASGFGSGINTGITNMFTEFSAWGSYFAFFYAVYLTIMFVKK